MLTGRVFLAYLGVVFAVGILYIIEHGSNKMISYWFIMKDFRLAFDYYLIDMQNDLWIDDWPICNNYDHFWSNVYICV